MKLVFLFLFISINAWTQDRLRLAFTEREVRQGALIEANLIVLPEQINLPLQKLKGSSFGESLYFHKLSPLLRKEGSETYEAEVQVIFIKPIDADSVTGVLAGRQLTFEWDRLKITPIDVPEKMLWADFSAPEFIERNLTWIWVTLILLPLIGIGIVLVKKYRRKKELKERRHKLISEFKSCESYEQVVSLWQKKRTYLQEFPQLEDPFRNLELVLFKYQFKPTQSADEKSQVMSAYRRLIEESEGGLRGI